MADSQLSKDSLERIQSCTSAQEVLAVMADEGFELTDEQLEAVAGGFAVDWSLEELLRLFGERLAGMMPEGFDPNTVWKNMPPGAPTSRRVVLLHA